MMVPMTAKVVYVNITITTAKRVYIESYMLARRKKDAIDVSVDEGGFSSVTLNVCVVALNSVCMIKVWTKSQASFFNCS